MVHGRGDMRIDPRFLVESGSEIYTGAELLLKGCLETPGGVGLLTGYPGSPVAGFFDSCHDIAGLLHEKGVAARMANNEALSVAMVNGAQMVGVKGIAVFKSVGLLGTFALIFTFGLFATSGKVP